MFMPTNNLKMRQQLATVSSLILFIGAITMRYVPAHDESEQNKTKYHVAKRNTSMLTAEPLFKDQLAPRRICADMMTLSGHIYDYKEDQSTTVPLAANFHVKNHVLKTYVDYEPTGTQAMIVVCAKKKYAAVVFRGIEIENLDD
jgi:hypothetical protein